MNRRVVATLMMLMLAVCVQQRAIADQTLPAYLLLDRSEADGKVTLSWRLPANYALTNSMEVRLSLNCQPPRIGNANVASSFAISDPLVVRIGGYTGHRSFVCPASHSVSMSWGFPKTAPLPVMIEHRYPDGVDLELMAADQRQWKAGDSEQTPFSLSYTLLGMDHIFSGYDHLAFVLCLILIAKNLRQLLIIVSGFTAAHSVTLALAALDLIRIDPAVTEFTIALSILLLATDIARGSKNTLTKAFPATVAIIFGLVHGLGFASFLGSVGLPEDAKALALFFFNVGVEIGQIIFIGAISMLSHLASYARSHHNSLYLGQRSADNVVLYCIGTISAYWVFVRFPWPDGY